MLATVAFTQIDDAAAARRRRAEPGGAHRRLRDAFMVGSAIALLGLIATLVLIRRSDSRAHVALGGAAAESPSAG